MAFTKVDVETEVLVILNTAEATWVWIQWGQCVDGLGNRTATGECGLRILAGVHGGARLQASTCAWPSLGIDGGHPPLNVLQDVTD